MSRPTINYIKCSGEQCDYFAPDEGICRACMMEAMKTETQQDGEQDG